MSTAKGLVVLGFSTALALGAGYSLEKWDTGWSKTIVAEDCGLHQDQVTAEHCQNVDVSLNAVKHDKEANKIYGALALVGVIGMVGTAVGGVGEISDSEYDILIYRRNKDTQPKPDKPDSSSDEQS